MNINYRAKTANKSVPARIKIFHKYRSGFRSESNLGFLVKISVRKLAKQLFIRIKKRRKARGIWVRSRGWALREDGSTRRFFDNAILLMRRRYSPIRGKIIGPTLTNVRKKRIINLFNKVF